MARIRDDGALVERKDILPRAFQKLHELARLGVVDKQAGNGEIGVA